MVLRLKFDCIVVVVNLNMSTDPVPRTEFNDMINRFVLALLANIYMYLFRL